MGKKRCRTKKISKGTMPSTSPSTVKLVARSVSFLDKMLNKAKAWKKGQDPWIVIETSEPHKKYKRVKANSLWGNPKYSSYNLAGKPNT